MMANPEAAVTNLLPAAHGRPRVWASVLVPLLLLTWAPLAGLDEIAIALSALTLALIHWCWRPIAATLLTLGFAHAVWLIHSEKLRNSGTGILWQDMVYALPTLGTNIGTLLQYLGLRGLLLVALFGIALIGAMVLERQHCVASLRSRIVLSLGLLIIYLPSAAGYVTIMQSQLDAFRQGTQGALRFAGSDLGGAGIARFIHSFQISSADAKWSATSSELFKQVAATLPKTAVISQNPPPDIFVVLNESQMDLMQFSACVNRDDCQLDMFSAQTKGILRGPLRVHTLGWGTWNSELALMTGLLHDWFGDAGMYSAYTVAPRVHGALASRLAELGYRTVAIYPTQKGMLNAASAYRHYGVEEFYGAEDLNLPLDWCQIPDRLMYQNALKKLTTSRPSDSRPVFMMMLTIINHGPHGAPCGSSSGDRPTTTGTSISAGKFEDYLQRSRQADAAASNFRQTIFSRNRPTLMLFFGDHQPSFEGLANQFPRQLHRAMDQAELHLFTSYQFFANYPLNQHSQIPTVPTELDIGFLATTLLELAGLDPGIGFQANRDLRAICQSRIDLCPTEILDSFRAYLAEIGYFH